MGNGIMDAIFGKKLGAKGVYIAAGACLIALAGVGTAAYNKASSGLDDGIVIQEPSVVAPAENKADSVAKDNGLTLTDSSKADSKADSSSKTESAELVTQPNVMPVNGEIINPFSNGELVKDETLGVWKTHDGIDIKSSVGTQVKSMNRGTVLEIKEDPLWGNCIIIDHGNGLVGYYYSLSKAMSVTEGDKVNAGDVIGAVGDTAECEAAELSHLHFGLKKNGEWVDPMEYLGLGLVK